MNERMYQQSKREFYAKEERRHAIFQGLTVLACVAAVVALGLVAFNMETMQEYWVAALVIAALIIAVFLSFGFGWILYGVLSAIAWLGFASLLGFLIEIANADPGAILAILFIAAVYGFARLMEAMKG